jgi:hypothetical protein
VGLGVPTCEEFYLEIIIIIINMLTWDLPTWDENNVTWDGMSHLGIWDGMSHYGKKLFHKTLIYTNVSAFYVMQTLLYKLVVHVEHTLSVRFCRG